MDGHLDSEERHVLFKKINRYLDDPVCQKVIDLPYSTDGLEKWTTDSLRYTHNYIIHQLNHHQDKLILKQIFKLYTLAEKEGLLQDAEMPITIAKIRIEQNLSQLSKIETVLLYDFLKRITMKFVPTKAIQAGKVELIEKADHVGDLD